MSNRTPRRQWKCFGLPVLALLALVVVVFYQRAFGVGVLSDGWVLLEIGSRGFRDAPFVLLSYHTLPVTNLFMAVLWKLFGLTEWWYQLTNLAEFLLVGWLLYLLGCALFRQARIALVGSLLFLANSCFYEVPFWPTVGNFQSLAALICLAAFFAVHQASQSARPWLWASLFSLCGVVAFFTYEPTVSVLGAGILYPFLVPRQAEGAFPRRERIRRALNILIPSVIALAAVIGSKLYTSSHGYQAILLPHNWDEWKLRIYLFVRGCLSVFSLVGADEKLYKILTFGLSPPGWSPQFVALLVIWLLILGIGGALLFWKTGSGIIRFLLLWFGGHMIMSAITAGPVPRHLYLAALPASLLSAWLLWRAADAVAAWIGRWHTHSKSPSPNPYVACGLVLLISTLLAVNAKRDLDTAGTLHQQATLATRQVTALVQQRLAENPNSPPKVALVNMPAKLVTNGIGAYAFVNGLHQVLRLNTGGRITEPELYYTGPTPSEGTFANGSRPLLSSEVVARAQDPGTLVLIFDNRTRTVTACCEGQALTD